MEKVFLIWQIWKNQTHGLHNKMMLVNGENGCKSYMYLQFLAACVLC